MFNLSRLTAYYIHPVQGDGGRKGKNSPCNPLEAIIKISDFSPESSKIVVAIANFLLVR